MATASKRVRLPFRYRLYRARPLLAYVLIVVVAAVGFYHVERADVESERQRDRLCAEAIVNREALRQVYRDVAALGHSLIETSPNRSPQEKTVVLEKFDEFQRQRIAALPPLSPDCGGDGSAS